ncbi:hypothetical protein [Mesorhizobium sp. M0977]|uniref:hypothetical protein n=1 Tax=Mesorhizobium sp. M0977 TaxID=2957039 RepID=UPI0033395D9C
MNIIILVQAVAKRLVGGPAVIRLAPGSQITAEPDADLYEGRSSLFALKLMLERAWTASVRPVLLSAATRRASASVSGFLMWNAITVSGQLRPFSAGNSMA